MIFFAILIGLLPSFVWLVFFLKEDINPEPRKMLAKVFIYGALIALVAVVFQYFFQSILDFFKFGKYTFVSFLTLSAIEEILKFTVVYLAISKSKFFDEPVDAMIYMITAALGFAALENIFIALSSLTSIFSVLTMRFVGATLLHALSSGIIGYYWALSRRFTQINTQINTDNIGVDQRSKSALIRITWGIALATLLHAVFNYLILSFDGVNIIIYPTVFLIIMALFVFKDFEKIKA